MGTTKEMFYDTNKFRNVEVAYFKYSTTQNQSIFIVAMVTYAIFQPKLQHT